MLAESAVCTAVLFPFMFDKAEKETKIIFLEENLITVQDVDIHVGTHMSLVKQARSSVLALNV